MQKLVLTLAIITTTTYPMAVSQESPDEQLLKTFDQHYSYQEANKRITHALERGVNINASQSKGKTALMLTVEDSPYRDHETMYKLCTVLAAEHGADTEAQDNDGMTALMHAAKNGLIKECEFLIHCGAKVDAKNPKGKTALMLAAHQHPNVCQLLLKHGANVNETDADGNTALLHTYGSNIESCKVLIGAGANIEHRRPLAQSTLLGHTALFNNKDTAQMLLDMGARITIDRRGAVYTDLTRAAQQGHLALCRMMLNAQANRNDAIRTLLLCLRQTEPTTCSECGHHKQSTYRKELYRNRKKLLIPYLKSLFVPIRTILQAVDSKDHTAFDYQPTLAWLNPKNAHRYKVEAPGPDAPQKEATPEKSTIADPGSCIIL